MSSCSLRNCRLNCRTNGAAADKNGIYLSYFGEGIGPQRLQIAGLTPFNLPRVNATNRCGDRSVSDTWMRCPSLDNTPIVSIHATRSPAQESVISRAMPKTALCQNHFAGFFQKVWARIKGLFGDTDAEAEVARINADVSPHARRRPRLARPLAGA